MSTSRGGCPFTNDIIGSPNRCVGTVQYQFFDYNVHLWNAALFVALFGLTSLLHLWQAIRGRRWYMLCTIFICGICETLGWAGRLWANRSVVWVASNGGYWASNRTAFLMQISTLIFAPAFLAAFWYILLGKLIRRLGPQYSSIKPLTYTIFFIIGDLVSLTIQAVGGGLASAANTLNGANNGAKIMVAGVIIQMFVMILYTLLLFSFVYRYFHRKPAKQFRLRRTQPFMEVPAGSVAPEVERKAKILLAAMLFSTLLIFIRSIYRTVELLNGWHGPIIGNETLFWVLDAFMVFFAMAIFNVIHPNKFLVKDDNHTARSMDEKHHLTQEKNTPSEAETPPIV